MLNKISTEPKESEHESMRMYYTVKKRKHTYKKRRGVKKRAIRRRRRQSGGNILDSLANGLLLPIVNTATGVVKTILG